MSAQYDFDLLCIGSGPAGQRAAVQAAKLGRRVALVERRLGLGGSCLSTGTIPSKTFREAVLHFAALRDNPERRRFAKFDYRPTADQLLARVERVMQAENTVIEDQLRRNDVVVLRGKASFVDAHRVTVEGPDGRPLARGAGADTEQIEVILGRHAERYRPAAKIPERR